MANPFDEPSISGYNSNPPPDDGTESAANEITWAGIKSKLADPIKDYVDAVISGVTDAFDAQFLNAVSAVSANYSVQESDKGKLLSCTNTITVTLLAVATAGSNFALVVKNSGSGTVTLDGNASETINGSATLDIPSGASVALASNGSAWTAVELFSFTNPTITKTLKLAKGADVASANALTLGTDGNYFDITGTTAITSIGTLGVGTVVKLHFDGALTLTHHATDLVLPAGANITTAAGDEAEFVEYATGDWRLTSYSSTPLRNRVFTSSGTFTARVTGDHIIILQAGGGGGGATVGGNNSNSSGGGGGGAAGEFRIITQSLTAGTGYTVTIGAGGASTTAGGNTVFDATTVIGGPDGGDGGLPTAGSGGRSGSVSGGTGGGSASAGSTSSGQGDGANGGAGGGSTAGGGGGGGGGCSHFGKGGVGGNGGAAQSDNGTAGTAAAATAYGAGGGGAGGGGANAGTSGAAGGAGANGIVIVIW